MRPKVYATYAEQKLDQRIGFVLFPVVNIAIWLIILLLHNQIDPFDRSTNAAQLKVLISWLPWIVNGLVLIPTLIFRRSIGSGYLVSLAGFTVLGAGLGLISVVTTFVSVPLLAIAGDYGLGAFLLILLAGGIWFLWGMIRLLLRWWKVW